MRSLRFRLAAWYVALFGVGLTLFSVYLFTHMSATIQRGFDDSLLRSGEAAVSYFTEFAERGQIMRGADETIEDLHLGHASIAVMQQDKVLRATDARDWAAISHSIATGAPGQPVFGTQGNRRTVVIPVAFNGVGYRVMASEALDDVYRQIDGIRQSLLVGIPVTMLLAIAGGIVLADRGLRPLNAMCAQAENISAHNLDARLPVAHKDDEIGRLSAAFNSLLARLEKSFQVMRSFMMDASHELRTPLSIIQGEVDVALSHERTAEEYRESLGILGGQARRMGRIVNDLLALSRGDAGQIKLATEELYLNDLVEESVRAAQSLAARKRIALRADTGEEDISITGNEELLRRMISNLIDNAIQYTPEQGKVDVKLSADGGTIRLKVADTGIGIAADQAERVFDRFYRVDASRNRTSGGAGLGLSIVKLAAESHHGTVRLESAPGHGSTFTVDLPSA